jgi:isoleucyl-tRNA synthetase
VWAAMHSSLVAHRPSPAGQEKDDEVESVHLTEMPKADGSIDWKSEEPRWQKLMELRDKVLVVLEPLRKDKIIGSNQEACITIYCNKQDAGILNEFGLKQFAALCIVSEVKLEKGAPQTTVSAQKSPHQKCQRCWNYWPSVGVDSNHPDLCERCVSVISRVGS